MEGVWGANPTKNAAILNAYAEFRRLCIMCIPVLPYEYLQRIISTSSPFLLDRYVAYNIVWLYS